MDQTKYRRTGKTEYLPEVWKRNVGASMITATSILLPRSRIAKTTIETLWKLKSQWLNVSKLLPGRRPKQLIDLVGAVGAMFLAVIVLPPIILVLASCRSRRSGRYRIMAFQNCSNILSASTCL